MRQLLVIVLVGLPLALGACSQSEKAEADVSVPDPDASLSDIGGGAPDSGGLDSGVGGADATDDASNPGTDAAQENLPLDWFSDWRTMLGSEQTALYDGGKWTNQLCASPVAEIVPSAGLGFPTDHVYRLDYVGPGNCLMVEIEDAWRAPAAGEYMFVRIYHRNDLPDGAVVGHPHPVHIGRGDPYAVLFNFSTPSNGQTGLRLNLPGAEEYPDAYWSYPLNLSQTVRIELRIHRTTATTAKVDVRVFDTDGALLADNDDFNNGEAPGAPSFRTLTDSDPTITVDDASFRLLQVGNNDPAGAEVGTDWFLYWGAAAVRISGDSQAWIGAYPTADEAR